MSRVEVIKHMQEGTHGMNFLHTSSHLYILSFRRFPHHFFLFSKFDQHPSPQLLSHIYFVFFFLNMNKHLPSEFFTIHLFFSLNHWVSFEFLGTYLIFATIWNDTYDNEKKYSWRKKSEITFNEKPIQWENVREKRSRKIIKQKKIF